MATKNISITEEAYILLLRRKLREKESFSEIITREFSGKEKLKQLFGILKGKKGEEFEKRIMQRRKLRDRLDKEKKEFIKEYFG